MAHGYPTAHHGAQTPAMRVGVCRSTRFFTLQGIDAPSTPTGTVGLLFSSMISASGIYISEQALSTGFCGVVKFIQVFHVHIFNAEFMQSADAQMIQPAARYLYPAGDSCGAILPESRRTGIRCRLPAGRPAPKVLAFFTVGNTVP